MKTLRILRVLTAVASVLLLYPAHAGLFEAEIGVSDIENFDGPIGITGFVLKRAPEAHNSVRMSNAGDLNADGIDDLVVGNLMSNYEGSEFGRAYIVFGKASGFPPTFELVSLFESSGGDGSAGFVLKGALFQGHAGQAVESAGDVNGDGIDDLIVGAPYDDYQGPNASGRSYIVFGSSDGFPAEFSLRDLYAMDGGDGTKGFVVKGIDEFDFSGAQVGTVGDVNGDGIHDIVICANQGDPNGVSGAGETYIVFGKDKNFGPEFELSSLLVQNGGNGSNGFIINGIDSSDFSCASASGAGDINNDGFTDIAIGSALADPGDRNGAGETYIVFGTEGGFSAEYDLANLLAANGGNGSAGFILNGVEAGDRSGESVNRAGDVNGDGIDDLIIGARQAGDGSSNAGETYVVYGSGNGFGSEYELSTLFLAGGGDGSAGFVVIGDAPSGALGASVEGIGDVNADGIDDLLIGAPGANESYVIFGKNGGFPAEFFVADLYLVNGGNGGEGFVLNGADAFDQLGQFVSTAGDVNADGVKDIIVSAPGGNNGDGYVLFGRDPAGDIDTDGVLNLIDNCLLKVNSAQDDTDGDSIGNACDADFNNDCVVNFLDITLFGNEFLGSNSLYDLNEDGVVNFLDFLTVANSFLEPPGPSGQFSICD